MFLAASDSLLTASCQWNRTISLTLTSFLFRRQATQQQRTQLPRNSDNWVKLEIKATQLPFPCLSERTILIIKQLTEEAAENQSDSTGWRSWWKSRLHWRRWEPTRGCVQWRLKLKSQFGCTEEVESQSGCMHWSKLRASLAALKKPIWLHWLKKLLSVPKYDVLGQQSENTAPSALKKHPI